MEFHYPEDKAGRRRFRLTVLFSIVLGTALLTLLGIVVYRQLFLAHQKSSPSNKTPYTPVGVNESEPPASVTGHYLFNGTVVVARAVEKYAHGDYNQPFSQLDTLNRSSYDAWSTDFECPVTNNVVPYQLQIDNLVFNCRPEFLPSLTKYFNLIDLANNHTDNQGGQTGLNETRQHFNDYPGTQYFGNFDPTVLKDICEVVGLPVRVQKGGQPDQKATLPVAFCAWHYFNYMRGPRPEELAVVSDYAQRMPVFAFVEMGVEYQAQASDSQVSIAHQIMDTGPEFLLANNPHWVQNAEVYKGKLIVYSLGNFIFDQLDTETQRGVSIDATLTVPYSDNVAKWLALGPECTTFQDDCLQKANDQDLQKVPLKLVYTPIASQGGAGKITHKADAATQAAVEQRLGWATIAKQLGQ